MRQTILGPLHQNRLTIYSSSITMARRYQHTLEEIRAMVLQAAETLVKEQGHTALNARKIAMMIGYSVGSIYMVFNNMAEITLTLNANSLDNIATFLNQAWEDNPTMNAQQFAGCYCRYIRQNPQLWQMVFTYPTANTTLPDWYQQRVNHSLDQINSALARILPTTASQAACQTLWLAINGLPSLSLIGVPGAIDQAELEYHMAVLIAMFGSGLQAQAIFSLFS
jgi:AcrR family transcriptional regulator